MPEFEELLAKHKDAARLTNAQLAQKARVSEATIRRYEQGKYTPTIDTLLAIASALNLDVNSAYELIKAARPELDSRYPNPILPLVAKALKEPALLELGPQLSAYPLVKFLSGLTNYAESQTRRRAGLQSNRGSLCAGKKGYRRIHATDAGLYRRYSGHGASPSRRNT